MIKRIPAAFGCLDKNIHLFSHPLLTNIVL